MIHGHLNYDVGRASIWLMVDGFTLAIGKD